MASISGTVISEKPGRISPRPSRRPPGAAPRVSPFWFSGFCWYVQRFVRSNFHAVRLMKGSALPERTDAPWIICMNHPSWWDPMIGVVLATSLMAGRRHFAVIDDAMLRRYPVFEKVGFVGVEPGTARGAAQFLRSGQAALALDASTLWVTAEGRFTDARVRPVVLRPGIAALARRVERVRIVPVALDYVFWNERYPEALCAIGPDFEAGIADPSETTGRLGAALESTMDRLSEAAMSRDPGRFDTLLNGSVGVGGFYDIWRRAVAMSRAQKFDAGHQADPRGGAPC